MAQFYFKYAAMNAGKSIELLKIANNYEEKGDSVHIFVPAIDDRSGKGKVASRIGIEREAEIIEQDTDLFERVTKLLSSANKLACILVDEAQFLTREQVIQLTKIVDFLNIPVMVFGLKTDFQANLFPGSEALLCFADKIEEMKTVCWKCDRKAAFNMRVDEHGKKVKEGEQVMIGGNESYVPVCRRHFFEY